MRKFGRSSIVIAGLVAVMAVWGCGDDDDDDNGGGLTPSGRDYDRVYVQIERLGNPLVSEVFLEKREHGHFNAGTPAEDVTNFAAPLEAFVTSFGRPQTLADGISGALLPDRLLVYPTRTGAAGWLSWALSADGYGGRRLQDDVVDIGLLAVFGSVLGDTTGQIPSLTSDNADANDTAFLTSFPYLPN